LSCQSGLCKCDTTQKFWSNSTSGCLNLLSYVKSPFTNAARFDYSLFFKHSKIAQRLMDDMVDLEAEKITEDIFIE
jgi:hypothetical protein